MRGSTAFARMNSFFKKFLGVELAVVAFSAWQSRALPSAWIHAPYDRLGWLAFLVWIAALPYLARRGAAPGQAYPLPSLAALALALAGKISEVNALTFAALAVSLCAFARPGAARALWLAGSVSWMPALGWWAHSWPVAAVAGLRLAVAVATCAGLLLARKPIRPV